MKTLQFFSIIAAFSAPVSAWAQTTPYDDKPTPYDKPGASTQQSGPANDKQTKARAVEVTSKDFTNTGLPEDTTVEKPNKAYRFVGLRFRETWIPKFMMSLFGDGGTTVGVPMFGPEFTIRKNNFEYVLSVMYADYAMSPTPFKAKSDPPPAWELVTSKLKVLYLMADFLWSTNLDEQQHFAINYGAGLGLGIVFGDLIRVQAAPAAGDSVANPDPSRLQPCFSVGQPQYSSGSTRYCNNDNNHYGNYSEPSWANGGSKPIVFPWLALQTGLRWKPHRQWMARLDLGWDLLNGPFVGIAANYGL